MGKANKGSFKPGNKVAVGNSGNSARPRLVTNAIIAKLNEVDGKTSRAHVFSLVDELFEQAMARDVKEVHVDAKGKRTTTTVRVLGDLSAKKEIIDRAEGKAIQGHSVDSGGGKVTFVFEPADEKL